MRDRECYLCLLFFHTQGFRLLLASPDAAYKLFRGLQSEGHGKAKLFEGRPFLNNTICCSGPTHHITVNIPSVELFQKGVKDEESITVDEILNNETLRAENNYVQVSDDQAQRGR